MAKVFDRVQQWPIEKLQPYEWNNQAHSDEQVAMIAKSIAEFGFDQPILANKDGLIIAGHGRWKAALQLNMETVPVVVTNLPSEASERARRIIDNKLTKDAPWQFENLGFEIGWLEDEGFPVADWGLDDLTVNCVELDGDLDIGKAENEFQQITFNLHETQMEIVRRALKAAPGDSPINENKNANKLTAICFEWSNAC